MQHLLIALFVFVSSASLVFPGNALAEELKIESLELDRTMVEIPCTPPLSAGRDRCKDAPVINAKIRVSGGDIDRLQLSQTVTGGRVNQGTNGDFIWDLTGAHAGRYSMTVTVADAQGRQSTPKAVDVTLADCRCELPVPTCPTVEILGPAGIVTPGQIVKVVAKLSEATAGISMFWSISDGVIVDGQGTQTISIDSTGVRGGSNIAVTLNLGMPDVMLSCPTEFTEMVFLASLPEPHLLDEFSTVRTTCEEGNYRLDNFFNRLNNDPRSHGLIIIYDSPDRPRAAWYREQLLGNFIKSRRFDRSRITFIHGTFRADAKTQFWLVPPGAAYPELLAGDTVPSPAEPTPPIKPYLYATRFADGLPECDVPMFDLVEYAKVLNTEPRSRGRIIIGEPSRTDFARTQREIADELAENGVPRSRLTFVYKYVRPNRSAEEIALWVVPPPVRINRK